MTTSDGYVTMDDGVRLYFQKAGTGPKTVVIPNGFHLLDDFERLASGRALIFYDVRNRGRSDGVTDQSQLMRGIDQDVDDLEMVRRHFGIDHLDLIGHSYVGLTVILYAMKYPSHMGRIVQIGASPPHYGKQYPAHLTCVDEVLRDVFGKLGQLEKERSSLEPEQFCRRFWALLRYIYVVNPADADRITWGRCHLPNERNLMKYWIESIVPSMERLNLTAEQLGQMKAPVLTIHGTDDRSAPYGGGREWALMLPDARLVTIEHAAHAPWIEAPDTVYRSIGTFLDGAWPSAGEKVVTLDPKDGRPTQH